MTASLVVPKPDRTGIVEMIRAGEDLSGVESSDVAELLAEPEALCEGRSTLCLRGVRGGALDLRGRSLQVDLRLHDCELDELNLSDARFIGVSVLDCAIGRVRAQRLQCSGSLLIQTQRSDRSLGSVQLDGARVGGNWWVGATLDAPASVQLHVAGVSADGIAVAGHALFYGTTCHGNLGLSGANVGRDLDLRAACVLRDGADGELSLHTCRIGGRLRLGTRPRRAATRIEGVANWRNLRVEGGVIARNAQFGGKLKLESAHLTGSLDFNGARFAERIQAMNARIDGDLGFDGAQLELEAPQADVPFYKAAGLDLSGTRISGCGFFGQFEGKPFRARAPLRLRATQFGERLAFTHVELYAGERSTLSLVGTKVGTELYLAPERADALRYDLRDVSCRLLSVRGTPAHAQLNGLSYTMLDVRQAATEAEASRNPHSVAREMLAWIGACHGQPESFAPGPYKALEAYLHATGAEGLSREVARERRRCELASERACVRGFAGRSRALARSVILWCAGYGYSATTALTLSVAAIGLFVAAALLLPGLVGQFCPGAALSCQPGMGSLLALAVDNFVPIVKLELADTLHPNGTAARCMLAGLRMSGWLLTTLMVASWSGLMRKP
ncbi:MAG TPA: pentapeptide repeat-containing protein [Polyangiales bacterium]|nr:pentapeptide repeat-containing protein [Polyangiales bacterium]